MLIAQMVAKDEADRFLEPVLAHLSQIVDMIIFTDDASDDNTPDIAEAYGAYVAVLDSPLFRKHEGQLRSLAWEHLESYAKPGDWILAIDADEMLYAPNLRQWMDQNSYDVLGIEFYHMWNETQYRVDKLWAPVTSSRLFRYYPGGEFAQRQLACGSEPTYVQTLIQQHRTYWQTGFRMKHLGYARDMDKVAKYQRYMELDGGVFHNRNHLESILDSHPTLIDWVD
jgi:glycosyltransferase involved in cell wall biosynthesis